MKKSPSNTLSYLMAASAVVIFGLTLPATRIAVAGLPATFVGLGRAIAAAVLAAIFLWAGGARRPDKQQLGLLALASAGIIFGFPLLSAIAMKTAPASHGGVVLGVLPLATAVAGVLFAGERPSAGFWLCAVAGAAAVVTFALIDGGAELFDADALLALSVVSAAIGYALSGSLARALGGWQVICWALVISVPVLMVPVIQVLPQVNWHASLKVWAAFAYVSVFSRFFGFFLWNQAMARAGVARIGQFQLFQVFVTLAASALLLNEPVRPLTVVFAVTVVAAVALGTRMRIHRTAPSQ